MNALIFLKRSFILIISLALFLGCEKEEVKKEGLTAERLTALSQNFLNQNPKVPGLVVQVESQGRQSLHQAHGLNNLSAQDPMQKDDTFISASITKLFIGALVIQLQEEDKLQLDDPIADFLPDEIINAISWFEGVNYGPSISIKQLLNHTSGIYDYLENGTFHWETVENPAGRYSNLERINYAIQNGNAYAAPGEFHYSNTNYILLDLIIEAASGQSLKENLHNRIIEPLSLSNTYFAPNEEVSGNIMKGYFDTDDISVYTHNVNWGAADGGIISNTKDLSQFGHALFSGTLFNHSNSLSQLIDFQAGYGLGVELLSMNSLGYIYGHTGATPGFTSVLAYVEELETTIVIAVNQTEQHLDDGNYLINNIIIELFE